MISFFREKFRLGSENNALIFQDKSVSYGDLLSLIERWERKLTSDAIHSGDVIAVIGDFSPNTIAAFFALAERKCIIVPLSEELEQSKIDSFVKIANISHIYRFDKHDAVVQDVKLPAVAADHPHMANLRLLNVPGLVLFSSGSTGQSKAALLNLSQILKKFEVEKRLFRTAAFLLFDHIGGINTLLYVLSNLGTFIILHDRSPSVVLSYIAKYKIELLPTTPTFIKLIILSEAYKECDLTSLKLITYGPEPMPQQTLSKIAELMPNVKLQQTYGLTEVGILRSHSRENGSLWVRIGGEGYQLRVVDKILQIRSPSTMLGYLNADAPFTSDGWFVTGDEVEVDGDYVRILGRKSEIINVGGLKVFPAEVEGEIEMLDFIESVVVKGEKNAILGNVVTARIKLASHVDMEDRVAISKIKEWCSGRLERFKVPVKFEITRTLQHNIRFKKMR